MRTCSATRAPIQIRFPRWHDGQLAILAGDARFRVAACGRRFGKSYLAQFRLAEPALKGGRTAYFAPHYKLLTDTWREVVERIMPAITRASTSERRIETTLGGSMEFWTLEDPHAGRSRRYDRVIIDEAGLVPHLGETWEASIRPTLTDTCGEADFYGTPLGRNYFWQVYQRGADPLDTEWAAWQMPSSANPHLPPQELEAARTSMTDRRYRQEYLAEFLEDGGGVFRFVREAATASPLKAGEEGHQYAIGVDWGREHDATVFAVFDIGERRMVAIDRMTKVDYALQRTRLHALAAAFPKAAILAEANSMGTPVIEQLQREGLRVVPFTTSNTTKAQIVDALALALEQRSVTLLNDPVLIGELEAFDSEKLPSGTLRYSAPEGQHDDCVMATCLSFWQAAHGVRVTAPPLRRVS